jgi:hypothetical protein
MFLPIDFGTEYPNIFRDFSESYDMFSKGVIVWETST